MQTVTIHDVAADGLAFDLIHILEAIGPRAKQSTWKCCGVECFGDGAQALHDASDSATMLEGEALFEIARDLTQTVDGTFAAFAAGSDQPWLLIAAIDSTLFEVRSSDTEPLHSLARRLSDVRQGD